MKTLEFIPTDFLDFQIVAKKFEISFTSLVQKGIVIVEADINELKLIGY